MNFFNVKIFTYAIAKQLSNPKGFLGVYVGNRMKKYNAQAIAWTVGMLKAKPSEDILEIGFGPGEAIHLIAQKINVGTVFGVDISRKMFKIASRRNARNIRKNKVQLTLGSSDALPYEDHSMDAVFGTHVVYFWKDPKQHLQEIFRVLKRGGRLVLYVITRRNAVNSTDVFFMYSEAKMQQLLEDVGFKNIEVHSNQHAGFVETGFCIIGYK